MLYQKYFLLLSLLFTLPSFQLLNARAADGKLKVLVLIIASDDMPVYLEEQKIWRSYMHYDPEHVEAYFLKSNPNLETTYLIQDDVMWFKQTEDIAPGLLNKTILALEAMLPRLKEFDYVLRPNMSSFYIFPRFLKYLETLPRKSCFAGSPLGAFASGCGFILSSDLAQVLVANKDKFMNRTDNVDDEIIGAFITGELKNKVIHHQRLDVWNLDRWHQLENSIPESIFQFRCKHANPDARLTEEVYIQSQLLKKFYIDLGLI